MENKEWPLVTVFTLVYNTGKYVVQALESVKANNYPNLQHIIIDDCSTDSESVQLVEQWIKEHNYPCTFIKHEKNQGICKTLNEVLTLANGKYIFGLSDDLMTHDRVQKQVEFFESLSDKVAVVYGDAMLINDSSDLLEGTFNKKFNASIINSPEGDIRESIVSNFTLPAVSAMIRRSCFDCVGNYDENLFYEDSDMWLRISESFEFKYLDKSLTYYRCHSGSVSNDINRKLMMYNTTYNVVKKHLSKNSNLDKHLKHSLNIAAENYYAYGLPKSTSFLLKSFTITLDKKILFFTVLSIFFKYQTVRDVISHTKSILG